MSLTFDQLSHALQTYTQNNNPQFIGMIPLFVANGQKRIVRDLKILPFIEESTLIAVFRADNSITAIKPLNWLSSLSVKAERSSPDLVEQKLLQERTVEYIQQYNLSKPRDFVPLYYADLDMNTILISSMVLLNDFNDEHLTVSLRFYTQEAPLSAENQQNSVSEYLPDLLLYSCLLETAPYLHDDERLQAWTTLYQQTKAAMSAEDLGRIQQQKPNTH